jgi:hypothetical protein
MAGTAASGVVLGHWLTYVLAIPEAPARNQILIHAGHSYWPFAVQAAVVLAVVALGSLILRHVTSLTSWMDPREDRLSRVALRLAWVQIAGFTLMEGAERWVAGAPVTGMFQHHLFLTGLLIQVLVACGGAFILLLVARAAVRLAEALRSERRERAPARLEWIARVADLRPRLQSGAAGLRSPPSL